MFRAFDLLASVQRREPGTVIRLGLSTFCCLICTTFFSVSAQGAGRIILRNTKIYRDPVVVKMDQDGVVLKGGVTLTWDLIERGTIGDKQADFNRLLKDLGLNLYRIRQRMEVGDYKGLLDYANKVYPRFRGRTSDTAYMVCQALMWSRIANGQRELAVEPFLQAFELQRHAKKGRKLPGRRTLKVDARTGISSEILPVWFDAAAAKKCLPRVAATIGKMKRPVPEGIRIYYGTLALSAGDASAGLQALNNIAKLTPLLSQFRQISLAQHEIATKKPGAALSRLRSENEKYAPGARALAWYWLGLSQLDHSSATVKQEGLLFLMRIPAIEGRRHPELAAAALYRSMKSFLKAKDAIGASAVRKELLSRYGQTFFAMKLKKELSPKRDN